jgi:sentrin-specific protease 8
MSQKFLDWKRYELSQSDAEILQHGGWLTSDIFTFAFALLCNKDGWLTHDQFSFINPLNIMMLMHGDDEDAACVVEDLALMSKDFLFIPLNDADATNARERGTHWRLLVFCKSTNTFHLYDSSSRSTGGSNFGFQTDALVARLSSFLISSGSRCQKIQEPCPQQVNGYDCGMYVISLVQFLCSSFSSVDLRKEACAVGNAERTIPGSPSELAASIKELVTPEYVTKRRLLLLAEAVRLQQVSEEERKK